MTALGAIEAPDLTARVARRPANMVTRWRSEEMRWVLVVRLMAALFEMPFPSAISTKRDFGSLQRSLSHDCD